MHFLQESLMLHIDKKVINKIIDKVMSEKQDVKK